jgi:PAS domain-containing protein
VKRWLISSPAEEAREQLLVRKLAAHAEAVAAQQRFRGLVNSIEGIVWEAAARTFEFWFVSQQAERILTERRWAEEALHESEEQWRAVFEHNPTMYFMVDAAGTILSVNPFGTEQLGCTV